MEKKTNMNVTFLMDEIADASLQDLHVGTKKAKTTRRKVAGGGGHSSPTRLDKSTVASRTRKVTKSEEANLDQKIKKLEIEMHNRFRLLQDRMELRMSGVEKRAEKCEEYCEKLKLANMELLKRVHQTNKSEIRTIQETLHSVKESTSKQQEEMANLAQIVYVRGVEERERSKSPPRSPPRSRSLKQISAPTVASIGHRSPERKRADAAKSASAVLDGRLSSVEQRLIGLEKDILLSVRPSHKHDLPAHTHEPTKLELQLQNEYARERNERERDIHARTEELSVLNNVVQSTRNSETLLTSIKKRLKECERTIAAQTKYTSDALSDQKTALLFLYRTSNIAVKSNMSDKEVWSVFGRLGVENRGVESREGGEGVNENDLW